MKEVNTLTYTSNPTNSGLQEKDLSFVYDLCNRVYKKAGGTGTLVVAGGAVRDTLLGLPYRDIDVFVTPPDGDSDYIDDFVTYMTSLIEDETKIDTNKKAFINTGYKEDSFLVHDLFIQGNEKDLPVQFIARDFESPYDLVKTFDYSLVKAYYDGSFHVTQDWIESFITKTITFTEGTDQSKAYRRAMEFLYRTGLKYNTSAVSKKAKVSNYYLSSQGAQWATLNNRYFELGRRGVDLQDAAEILRGI